MIRKTITLTQEDAEKLARLEVRHGASSSKIMRAALRRFYEEAASQSLERAYKEYYAEDRKEHREVVADFILTAADTW